MNTVTWWYPFKEVEELQDRLGAFSGRPPLKTGKDRPADRAASPWMPQVEITEDTQEYLIEMELPELRREDLTVIVEDGILQLAGKWQSVQSGAGNSLRAHGSFWRSLTLPEGTDPATVTAEFYDGTLRVHIQKVPKPQTIPRMLKVE